MQAGVEILGSMSRIRLWFLFFCCGLTGPFAWAQEIRTLDLKAAVSPQFKQNPGWKEDILARVEYVNSLFEPLFHVRFSVQQFIDWTPQDETREMDLLMEELRSFIPLEWNEVVAGFHRMSQPFSRENVIDMDTVGSAQAFRGFMVLRDPYPVSERFRKETVLAHEAAHLFGAVHVADPRAIMSPTIPPEPASTFDDDNQQIIRATRKMDFTQELSSAPAPILHELIQIYERKIQENPHSDFYYQLGLFYKHLDNPHKAAGIWEEALRYQYENPHIHRELGLYYYENEKYDLAIAELGRAIAHFILPSQKKQRAQVLNILGVAYYLKGDRDQAIFNWLKGLTAHPEDPDLLGNLAVVYLESNDLDKAVPQLEKIVRKNPEDTTMLSNLGVAYMKAKDFQKAADLFTRAIASKKASPPSRQSPSSKMRALMEEISESILRLNLGAAYLELGRHAEALDQLEQSKALDPDNLEIHRNLAQAYLRMEEFEEAIGEIEAALKYDPKDPYLYAFLGQAQSSLGETAKAAEAVQKGLLYAKQEDLKASLYKNLGILQAREKKFPEAVNAFRSALNLEWKDAATHTYLAMAYAQMGQEEEALRAVEAALKIDPQHPEAKKLREALNSNLQKTK